MHGAPQCLCGTHATKGKASNGEDAHWAADYALAVRQQCAQSSSFLRCSPSSRRQSAGSGRGCSRRRGSPASVLRPGKGCNHFQVESSSIIEQNASDLRPGKGRP